MKAKRVKIKIIINILKKKFVYRVQQGINGGGMSFHILAELC